MISQKAFSKINTFLKVNGKLNNGYHSISTIYLPLRDLYDIVYLDKTPEEGIQIKTDSNFLTEEKDNLCYKAADIFAKRFNLSPAWKIYINKNLPIAAGLGGGSSDAAAVLLMLSKLYFKNQPKEIFKIAQELGADVPFFLNPTPSYASGVGDKLQALKKCPDFYVVLISPNFPVSAAWAYENYSIDNTNKCLIPFNEVINCFETGYYKNIPKTIYNDLSFPIYEKFPLLEILKSKLFDLGIDAVEITGSGPSLFGITKTKEKASQINQGIKEIAGENIFCYYSRILL